jgi:hypothetical protein
MSSSTNIHHIGIGKILETRPLAVHINQRSYSWTEREIDDLWSDLKWAIDEGEKEYFLGTIVLTVPEGKRPLVVDGQQRLASVSMIYAATRDYLLNLGEDAIAKDIEPFLTNTDRWSRTQTAKLELSAQDKLFFNNHVLSTPNSEARRTSRVTKTSPDSHKRIAKAFKKLSESLRELLGGAPEPLKILKRWDTFLQTSAKLIVLEVDDESSAFQVFETLNDRGLDLAVTDLLKNHLFGKAGKENLDAVRHHWTTAVSRIGDGDESVFKRFVHHFWSSMHGLTRERLLYKNIKDQVKTPNGALSFTSALSASASNYAALLNSDADYWNPMGSAARTAVSTLKDLKLEQYKPLLLACMDIMDPNRPQELAKILNALVAWSVRFRVTQQFGSSKLEDFYGNGGKLVRDRSLRTASEIIRELKHKVPTDGVFIKEFEELREENARISRYYLLEIEGIVRKKVSISDQVDPDEQINNLEHILPKEPDLRHWDAFSSEAASVYVFRIGNQTVLSKKDNQKLGNSDFETKRTLLAKSSVLVTRQIATYSEWNERTIEQHQKWLASFAAEAWPIDG